MSESADELPTASGDKTDRTGPAQQVFPVRFDKDFSLKGSENDESDLFDFRPIPVSASEPDPKGSSVPEPVDSSTSEELTEVESKETTETPATAAKDTTPPKETRSGAQTSSSQTSDGKTKETAKA